MKTFIAVLFIALVAAVILGVAAKKKSQRENESLAGQLDAERSLAASSSVAVAKQIADLQTLAVSNSAVLAKQIDDLKFELASTNAAFASQSESLQAQVAAANAYAKRAQSQLAGATAQIAVLAPQAARARTLPLYVTWRRSFTGSGSVMQIYNTSTAPLSLSIQAGNATNGTKTFNQIANEKIPVEIGGSDGWNFGSGDKVIVSSVGFDSQAFNCP
jgi:hypothetical protein